MSVTALDVRRRYAIYHYLAVARLDHWFKNLLVIPGIAAAVLFTRLNGGAGTALDAIFVLRSGLLVLLCCLVSSTNYIINEILDAPHDAKHPTKCHRPVPRGLVSIPVLLVIAAAALGAALAVGAIFYSPGFVAALGALFVSGLAYNVPPVRAKDLPYVDVLCESANNPIRLMIGWFGVGLAVLPPVSLLIAYWALGAFLMTAKRYAEMRAIGDVERAAAYRRSFRYYTAESLLIAMITYISGFMYCYGFISVRYKIELMFAMPFVLAFVAWFFHLAFQKDSMVKEPERVVQKPYFLAFSALTFVAVLVCALADFGWLWTWLNSLHIGKPIG